jgi:hypothetical protein
VEKGIFSNWNGEIQISSFWQDRCFFCIQRFLKNSALRFLTNNNKIRENDSSNTHDPTYIAAIGLVVE